MTRFNLQFSGECRKVEYKQLGESNVAVLNLCRKNYTKADVEPTFTWVKVTVRDPKEFQKFTDGAFVSGSGEMTMSSYTAKDGTKKHSIEVRCSSFDIEVYDASKSAQAVSDESQRVSQRAAKSVVPKSDAVAICDEPPF